MRKLQTDVANCLGMERGEENSQKVRLDHRQYKRAMQEVEEKTKELQRELKEVKQENTELKYSFKEMQKTITSLENLTTEQKRELHFLNSKIKNEKAEYEELLKKLDEYKQNKLPRTNENILNDKSIELKEKSFLEQFKSDFDNNFKVESKGLVKKTHKVMLKDEFVEVPNVENIPFFRLLKKKIKDMFEIVKEQTKKILQLETENKELKAENKLLKKEISELSTPKQKKENSKAPAKEIENVNALDEIRKAFISQEHSQENEEKEVKSTRNSSNK